MREARARVIAVDAKPIIDHEAPQAIEHPGTTEPVAFRKEKDRGEIA